MYIHACVCVAGYTLTGMFTILSINNQIKERSLALVITHPIENKTSISHTETIRSVGGGFECDLFKYLKEGFAITKPRGHLPSIRDDACPLGMRKLIKGQDEGEIIVLIMGVARTAATQP